MLNKGALLAQLAFFTHVQARLNIVQENCRSFKVVNAGKSKETVCENLAEGAIDRKFVFKGRF